LHEVGLVNHFEKDSVESGEQRDRKREHTKRTKHVDRFRLVRRHKFDRHQIENDFQRARQAVFRLAHRPRVMFDRNLSDARAGPRRIDRNEAMHLAVQPDVL
jgi:hypothetical protein